RRRGGGRPQPPGTAPGRGREAAGAPLPSGAVLTEAATTAAGAASGGHGSRGLLLPVSLAALAAVLLVAGAVGSADLEPRHLVGALVKSARGEALSPLETIAWRIRLPRVLLAGLTGAGLSLAGALFQGVFRNPLADPYLIGTASGAGFGAVLVFTLSASFPARK